MMIIFYCSFCCKCKVKYLLSKRRIEKPVPKFNYNFFPSLLENFFINISFCLLFFISFNKIFYFTSTRVFLFSFSEFIIFLKWIIFFVFKKKNSISLNAFIRTFKSRENNFKNVNWKINFITTFCCNNDAILYINIYIYEIIFITIFSLQSQLLIKSKQQ